MEIVAGLANGAVLFAIVVAIAFEAMSRLRHPTHVNAPVLLAIAAVGFAANVVAARILHHGHDHSLNQRAAFLHVVGDLLGSLAALVAGGAAPAARGPPPPPPPSLAPAAPGRPCARALVRRSA